MIDPRLINRLLVSIRVGTAEAYQTILAEMEDLRENEPVLPRSEMDTLGSLTDKLVTVSLKMWTNQEVLYEIRRMTPSEFKKRWGADPDGLHQVIKRCCDLNVQRSSLMDEIDKYLRDAISGSKPIEELVRLQHKTY